MDELEEIFCTVLDIEKNIVCDNLSREDCENWDSFNHLLLFSEIEESTGIKFTISEIESINTYGQLKTTFEKKVVIGC
jgi:acyl carrier protein